MRQLFWENERARRLGACVGALAIAGLLWLVLLPAIGNVPSVRRYIDYNERAGIDPSAKFYSELPAMGRLIDRAVTAQRGLPD